MIRRLFSVLSLVSLTATSSFAGSFERPIPQPQSATAELWYAAAALALCAALFVVHRVVAKR